MERLSRPHFIADASPAPPTWIHHPNSGPGASAVTSSAKGKTVISVYDISSACLPVEEDGALIGRRANAEGDTEFIRWAVDLTRTKSTSKVPTASCDIIDP